jgi:hypothetical protein
MYTSAAQAQIDQNKKASYQAQKVKAVGRKTAKGAASELDAKFTLHQSRTVKLPVVACSVASSPSSSRYPLTPMNPMSIW